MFQLERYDDILILFSTRLMSLGRWDLRPEYAFFISKLMEKVKCYEVAEVMLYEVEKKDPEYLKWSDSLANFKIKPYDFMKLHPRILSVSGRIEFRRSKPAFQEKLNFVEILDEALKYLERIKRNSDDALAHYGLALLCEKVGNFEGAEKELKEVLKIKPDFTQAQEKLEYLEKRRSGEIEKKMN
jgi:tetratricopeptide (TPR) repeat protein